MQKQLELMRKYDISVRGIRGQHFLIDPNLQRKIVALLNPTTNDCIVEIGPGLGALTELLCQSGACVSAVEKDPRFCDILKTEYGAAYENLSITKADILSVQLPKLFPKQAIGLQNGKKLKIIGNLPYYITSPILLYLISSRDMIDLAVLTMQKEIADRLLAKPGTKNYGRLTLLAQFYGTATRALDISPHCFTPIPKVKSSVVTMTFHQENTGIHDSFFFELVKNAFHERRKNIANALKHGFRSVYEKEDIEDALAEAEIPANKRAEQLFLKDFLNLAQILEAKKTSRKI